MRVIAIDPGYDRLGIAVLEHQNGKEALLYSVCVTTNPQAPLTERLLEIGAAFENVAAAYAPHALAIETLFFNKNQKTAIGVAEARGIVLYLAGVRGCRIYEFGPQEVKVAVTGYGKSDKTGVVAMIRRLIPNCPEKAHDDEFDAIAVGITCLAHHKQ